MELAVADTAMPLRTLLAHDKGAVYATVFNVLTEADLLCGDRCKPVELELLAKMVVNNFSHRNLENIVLAIRDGLLRTDDDGKVYGKLTWPTIMQWMQAHEDAVMAIAEDQHSRTVVKNDNVGKDWLDREERKHYDKDKRIERQSRMIDELRRKLELKKEGQ